MFSQIISHWYETSVTAGTFTKSLLFPIKRAIVVSVWWPGRSCYSAFTPNSLKFLFIHPRKGPSRAVPKWTERSPVSTRKIHVIQSVRNSCYNQRVFKYLRRPGPDPAIAATWLSERVAITTRCVAAVLSWRHLCWIR